MWFRQAATWRPVEWELYVESLPRDLPVETLAELDRRHNLTASRNYDILEVWLSLALEAGYAPAVGRAEEVLGAIGRLKYLKPIYRAMATRPETRERAHAIYERCKARCKPQALKDLEEAEAIHDRSQVIEAAAFELEPGCFGRRISAHRDWELGNDDAQQGYDG